MQITSYTLRSYRGTAEDIAAYLAIQLSLDPNISQQTLTAEEAASELSEKDASFIMVDGKIAGFIAHCERDEGGVREGFVWELIVLERFRRQHIGLEIMKDVLLQYRNLKQVTLHVSSNNNRALGLYSKLGFKPVKEVAVLGRSTIDHVMTFIF